MRILNAIYAYVLASIYGNTEVLTGDTVRTHDGTILHLFGIRAPNVESPLGQRSKHELQQFAYSMICHGDTERSSCYILENGQWIDLGRHMILMGLASKKTEGYKVEENWAREHRMGIWS